MSANSTSTGDRFREYVGDAITKLPPKPWLIDQIVGENDFVMIFGQSGSGKSFMAIELAMCGITGKTFGLDFKVKEPITVAYMTNEGTSGLAQRFRSAALKHTPTSCEWSRLHVFVDLLQFVDESDMFHVKKFIEQWTTSYGHESLDLLILDHLSGTLPGKGDSDSGAATLLHQNVARLKRELSCSVVMIHHTGYDLSHSRGMTTYKDIADVQIQIKSTDDPRTMVCAKNKDGETWKSLWFALDKTEESAWVKWIGPAKQTSNTRGENRYIAVLRKANKPLTSADVAKKAGVAPNTAMNQLKKLSDAGQITRALQHPGRSRSKTNHYLYSLPRADR